VTELDILRRRRALVLVSAELQRATVVRRLEHVNRHPLHAVLGLATSVATVPLLVKLGSMLIGRLGRKREARAAAGLARVSLFSRLAAALRYLPILKLHPVVKFLNR
jgi:hypothetical protein